MFSPRLVCAAALALCLFAGPAALAKVYIDKEGKADREDKSEHRFEVKEDLQEFKLTVKADLERAGHLRVYFYEPSPKGGWAEIQEMRVILRDNTDKATTFKLPKNRYKVKISVRRVAYTVKLEDAVDEE